MLQNLEFSVQCTVFKWFYNNTGMTPNPPPDPVTPSKSGIFFIKPEENHLYLHFFFVLLSTSLQLWVNFLKPIADLLFSPLNFQPHNHYVFLKKQQIKKTTVIVNIIHIASFDLFPGYNKTSDGWFEWNRNQYYINRNQMGMEDARRYCQQRHSDLVTISSEAERVFLWKLVSSNILYYTTSIHFHRI